MSAPESGGRLIPAGAGRSVWVFDLALSEDAAASLARDGAALAAALGVPALDSAHVELINADDFKDYGFARFLSEGHGIPVEAMRADSLALDTLSGPVLLIYRPAFPPGSGQIAPEAPLRLIGRYDEPAPAPHQAPIDTPSAHGTVDAVAKRRPSDGAISGRIATLVLAFLALFVIVFVWIAA